MIEVTGEMIDAFWDGHDQIEDGGTERALAAVLAIIERDYRLTQICTETLGTVLRCTRETYGEPHRGEHEAKTSTGNTVRWS